MQIDNATADGGSSSGMVVFLCTASGRVLSASPRADELFPTDGDQTLQERLEPRLRMNSGPLLQSALIDGEETFLIGLMNNWEVTLGITPLD